MIAEILIFILTFIVLFFWYKYKSLHKYLDKKNVKYLPGVPFFGNNFGSTVQKKHMFTDVDNIYKAFPNERYVGYVENTLPIILIRDPELIKMITVKDFNHFVDHRDFFSVHIEPLFASNLFAMKGEKWRDMRTTLSPAFTSSKMRQISHLMVGISKNILAYVKDHSSEEIDVDDLMRRYTNDVIASASFGLEVNSLVDRDNEFFKIGQSSLNFNTWQIMVMTLDKLCPKITKFLGLKLYPKKFYDFFTNTVLNTLEYRKANNVQRPDMLQLLLETPREWSIDELCGQAFIFFVAGFETSSSLLVLTIHELAINPEIQDKLYQEVKAFKDANENITSENIGTMKYLDCVLQETLRKWSPAIIIDRKCVKTYELPPPHEGGKPCILNPGDVVYNSANSIHLDPQYYPDPFKYDPERFSDENKHNIKPGAFQPFGLGPRICIGSRFALLEAKILMYHLVANFKIVKSAKTVEVPELIDSGFNIKVKGGTYVKFEERS